MSAREAAGPACMLVRFIVNSVGDSSAVDIKRSGTGTARR